jgi:hypothetical protein
MFDRINRGRLHCGMSDTVEGIHKAVNVFDKCISEGKADLISQNEHCKERMRKLCVFRDGIHFPGLFKRDFTCKFNRNSKYYKERLQYSVTLIQLLRITNITDRTLKGSVVVSNLTSKSWSPTSDIDQENVYLNRISGPFLSPSGWMPAWNLGEATTASLHILSS